MTTLEYLIWIRAIHSVIHRSVSDYPSSGGYSLKINICDGEIGMDIYYIGGGRDEWLIHVIDYSADDEYECKFDSPEDAAAFIDNELAREE